MPSEKTRRELLVWAARLVEKRTPKGQPIRQVQRNVEKMYEFLTALASRGELPPYNWPREPTDEDLALFETQVHRGDSPAPKGKKKARRVIPLRRRGS